MTEITIVRANCFERYDLVRKFLALRRAIFIDRLAWPLFEYEDIEFEQYDTFNSVYVIAHAGSEVYGGARLIRTDQTVGTGNIRYTYMIKDAFDGLLPGMPGGICYEPPPEDGNIWELTRLATRPTTNVARSILDAANRFLAAEGAVRCLFLGPPAFLRLAQTMGYTPTRLGPTVRNNDGSFVAFSCAVRA